MTLEAGTRLGRYEIQTLLGIGGMGEVYRALDTELNRPVALKLLPAEFALHPDRVQRFVQEARAASALNHPNILTVYDIGRVSDDPNAALFLATELIDGVTLKEYQASSKIKLTDVLDITSQIASALGAAHAAGIVHRDIKPENVMVRPDGYVKLLDFGLAKPTERSSLVDSQAPTRALVNTDPGTVMGTVSYMSPEQARGEHVDARTDIWSLGCLFYELITGHLPFTGPTPSHVIVSLLENEPPSLATYVVDVPEALELIVEEALRKDRDERTQTAKQMLGSLRRLKLRIEAGAELERSLAPPFASDPSGQRLASYRSGQSTLSQARVGSAGSTGLAVPTTSSAEYVVTQIKQHKKAALVALALILIAAVGISLGTYWLTNRDQPIQSARSITKLTNSGQAMGGAISSDGKYVAHILTAGDKASLVLRQVATSVVREIVPMTEDYFLGATFTPDGNHLYYVRGPRGGQTRTLHQVSVLGGDSRQLLHDIDSSVSFSPDGKRFAFVRVYPKERENVLFVANADGSHEERIVTKKTPALTRISNPIWSPLHNSIAFITSGTDDQGYYVNVDEVGVEDKVERKISSDRWRSIVSIAWLPDGSGLLATARDRASVAGSPTQIWRLPYPAGAAQRVTNDLDYYTSVSIAADSRTVVAGVFNRDATMWIAPEGNSIRAKQIRASRFSGIEGLAWTPDDRVIYTSVERDNLELWIVNSDGANLKQLTFDNAGDLEPSVSPDGRYVVFVSNRGVGWGIWRINIDGGNPIELAKNIQDDSAAPQFTPDSQSVIYSARAGGKRAVWKVPVDGGTPALIVEDAFHSHTLSPDGKMVAYYFTPSELDSKLQIRIVPAEGGPPIKTMPLVGDASRMRWSPDGSALDYIETRDGVANLWRLPINGGGPRKLTDWKDDLIFRFAWSRDGKQLACARGVHSNDLVLLEGLDVSSP